MLDFLTDFELHKNKSARVVPIALEQWFVNNIPIDETIRNHSNLYDFCIRQKANKDFHYEGINKQSNTKVVYNKLIRYYVSNSGEKLLKVKNPECQTNAAAVSQVEAGEWVCTVRNYLPKDIDVNTADINYDFYIEKANRITNKILLEGKKNKVKIIPGQLNLFS